MRLVRSFVSLLLVFALLFVPCLASSRVIDEVYTIENDTMQFDNFDVQLEGGILLEDNSNVSTFAVTQEQIDNGDIKLQADVFGMVDGTSYDLLEVSVPYSPESTFNSVKEFIDSTHIFGSPDFELAGYRLYLYSTSDGIVLADKGTQFDFAITNLVNSVTIRDEDNGIVNQSNWWHGSIESVEVRFRDRLGTTHKVNIPEGEFITKQTSSDTVGLQFSVSVPVDAYRISVFIYVDPFYEGLDDYVGKEYYKFQSSYGFRGSKADFSLGEDDVASGFFASIIEWLQSIRDGITGLKDGIANVVNNIAQLPSKIWNYISDGLKSLFIPSEEDMIAIKDDWDSLLGERFGAIYEAGSLLVDWANNFQEQSAKDTISMPSVTVDLAGADFTFGGYEVELVPDRFDFLVEILRGVLDICCTLLFVNTMKKRYDNVVGGESA